MKNSAFLKRVAVAGGFLFLCATPQLTFGQSSPPVAAPPPPMSSTSAASPPDLLEGVTVTDDQKVKIDQIREDTKSRLAAVANDKKLSPEAADAMFQGFQRIENGKIFEMLTPEQQREVRRRMNAWKATAPQRQRQLKQPPVLEGTPQSSTVDKSTATSNQP